MNERLIFVTNDDSYASKGFKAAIEVARQFGRVIAIAPDTVQSGKSQAITLFDTLRLKKISEQEDVTIYSLNGTPVDCVRLCHANSLFLWPKPSAHTPNTRWESSRMRRLI